MISVNANCTEKETLESHQDVNWIGKVDVGPDLIVNSTENNDMEYEINWATKSESELNDEVVFPCQLR